MYTILCTGDSHAWGQGAAGLWEEFAPPPQPGESRCASFAPPSYVNLLRNAVCELTGSAAAELQAPELCERFGLMPAADGFAETQTPFTFDTAAELLRIQLRAESRLILTCDGAPLLTCDLTAAPCPVYNLALRLDGEPHALRFAPDGGRPLAFYRIESYRGAYAVVNTAVGSCTAGRYSEEYWGTHVLPYAPDLVLLQAHTVNDWISGKSAEAYGRELAALIRRFQCYGAQVVLLTAAPVSGPQRWPESAAETYNDFVAASRAAAAQCGVPIADANALINRRLRGGEALFADNWHPNNLGHRLYAISAINALRTVLPVLSGAAVR